jgi:hypothetical protein
LRCGTRLGRQSGKPSLEFRDRPAVLVRHRHLHLTAVSRLERGFLHHRRPRSTAVGHLRIHGWRLVMASVTFTLLGTTDRCRYQCRTSSSCSSSSGPGDCSSSVSGVASPASRWGISSGSDASSSPASLLDTWGQRRCFGLVRTGTSESDEQTLWNRQRSGKYMESLRFRLLLIRRTPSTRTLRFWFRFGAIFGFARQIPACLTLSLQLSV